MENVVDWLIIDCLQLSPYQEWLTYIWRHYQGLQNIGLLFALSAFEQERIFIVPHLLWHGASIFPVLSEGSPHAFDRQGDAEGLSSGVPIQSSITIRKGVLRIYSYSNPLGGLFLYIGIHRRTAGMVTFFTSQICQWDAFFINLLY
jgi:hypothetical protein